jgi:hypothetical protein
MKIKNKYNFSLMNKVYSLNSTRQNPIFFNKDLINNQIHNFFNEIKHDISLINRNVKNKHLLILFRVQYTNNTIATIGKLQRINLNDSEISQYIEFLSDLINFKDDHYKLEHIKNIIFSFAIKDGNINNNFKKFDEELHNNNKTMSFFHYKLPIEFNPLKYEKVIKISKYDYIVPLKNEYFIQIKVVNSFTNKCKLYKKNQLILEYIDKKINDNIFTRTINNNKYTFYNANLELKESFKKTKFINRCYAYAKNNSKKQDFNFITLDIETYLDKNNYHIPYCICIYDGIENKSFYLNDFKSSDDMLINAIKSISIRKYKNYNIYAHNLSSFDGIFLLKILNKIGIVEPVIKDGRIISINFTFESTGKRIYTLRFFDSYLLLPNSLRKLGNSFNVSTLKGNFDPTIIDKNNYISYKNEVIDYCRDDCISLYQILIKFNKLIFDNFNISIKNFPTLPSLTFTNFKSNYLQEDQIAQLSGVIEKNIRKSYTGGAVDMYIPFNNINILENLIVLDVNSLYPFVMKKFEFPVGEPTYFEGDITKINKDAFGIFYCEIKAPKKLEHPIIQTHTKTRCGIRTIAGLGE